MRVVIDTNVIVSGILNPHGSPGRIVNALLSEAITALYDDRILSEYREVLRRPAFGFSGSDVETLLDFAESAGEHLIQNSEVRRISKCELMLRGDLPRRRKATERPATRTQTKLDLNLEVKAASDSIDRRI